MLMRCFDLETTGVPTEDDRHAVCEIGYTDVIDGEIQSETIALLVEPNRPMPAEAQAVHHIGDDDLFGAPPITTGFMMLMDGPPDCFVAHFADFEKEFFKGGEVPWIDTYKVALRLWPDAPGHSLQVLRYHLGLDLDFDRAFPPHRAGPDSYACAGLMKHILDDGRADFARMVSWSKGRALLPKITFGNMFKGKSWDAADDGYLHWILDKSDLSLDIKANAKLHLKQRGKL